MNGPVSVATRPPAPGPTSVSRPLPSSLYNGVQRQAQPTQPRPRSLAELTNRAKEEVQWDETHKVTYWLHKAEEFKEKGHHADRDRNIERSFVEFAKCAEILHKLKESTGYRSSFTDDQRTAMGKSMQQMMDKMYQMKPDISDRYETWKRSQPLDETSENERRRQEERRIEQELMARKAARDAQRQQAEADELKRRDEIARREQEAREAREEQLRKRAEADARLREQERLQKEKEKDTKISKASASANAATQEAVREQERRRQIRLELERQQQSDPNGAPVPPSASLPVMGHSEGTRRGSISHSSTSANLMAGPRPDDDVVLVRQTNNPYTHQRRPSNNSAGLQPSPNSLKPNSGSASGSATLSISPNLTAPSGVSPRPSSHSSSSAHVSPNVAVPRQETAHSSSTSAHAPLARQATLVVDDRSAYGGSAYSGHSRSASQQAKLGQSAVPPSSFNNSARYSGGTPARVTPGNTSSGDERVSRPVVRQDTLQSDSTQATSSLSTTATAGSGSHLLNTSSPHDGTPFRQRQVDDDYSPSVAGRRHGSHPPVSLSTRQQTMPVQSQSMPSGLNRQSSLSRNGTMPASVDTTPSGNSRRNSVSQQNRPSNMSTNVEVAAEKGDGAHSLTAQRLKALQPTAQPAPIAPQHTVGRAEIVSTSMAPLSQQLTGTSRTSATTAVNPSSSNPSPNTLGAHNPGVNSAYSTPGNEAYLTAMSGGERSRKQSFTQEYAAMRNNHDSDSDSRQQRLRQVNPSPHRNMVATGVTRGATASPNESRSLPQAERPVNMVRPSEQPMQQEQRSRPLPAPVPIVSQDPAAYNQDGQKDYYKHHSNDTNMERIRREAAILRRNSDELEKKAASPYGQYAPPAPVTVMHQTATNMHNGEFPPQYPGQYLGDPDSPSMRQKHQKTNKLLSDAGSGTSGNEDDDKDYLNSNPTSRSNTRPPSSVGVYDSSPAEPYNKAPTPRRNGQIHLPQLPLQSPRRWFGDESSADEKGGKLPPLPKNTYGEPKAKYDPREQSSVAGPPPMTTTSPRPPELINVPLTKFMSGHQKGQGYTPSLHSIVMAPEPAPSINYTRLLDNRPSVFEEKNLNPVNPYPRRPGKPSQMPVELMDQRAQREAARVRHIDPQRDKLRPELKPCHVPGDVLKRFTAVAAANTEKKIETLGLLMGRYKSDKYTVTTLLVPRQRGGPDWCVMEDEEMVLQFQERRFLMTLGWIHTHPTQSCFMSSCDLHSHAPYQKMLPEAFAIVCAPRREPNFGVFRLTDPNGLNHVLGCKNEEMFHEHSARDLYTDCDQSHVSLIDNIGLEICDIRTQKEIA